MKQFETKDGYFLDEEDREVLIPVGPVVRSDLGWKLQCRNESGQVQYYFVSELTERRVKV